MEWTQNPRLVNMCGFCKEVISLVVFMFYFWAEYDWFIIHVYVNACTCKPFISKICMAVYRMDVLFLEFRSGYIVKNVFWVVIFK